MPSDLSCGPCEVPDRWPRSSERWGATLISVQMWNYTNTAKVPDTVSPFLPFRKLVC